MGVGDFITYVLGQLAVIKQAPIPFFGALLVCALFIWLFIKSQFSGRFETLNARIALRDDQIGQLQRSVKADSPSEALLKIGELNAQIEALSIGKWPPLTGTQVQRIRDLLANIRPGNVHFVVEDDGRAMLIGLATIFRKLNWRIRYTRLLGSASGIEIAPKNDTSAVIAKALTEGGGLDVDTHDGVGEDNALTITIGFKPF